VDGLMFSNVRFRIKIIPTVIQMSTTLDPNLDWENLVSWHAAISGGREMPV
jgi:hypothetical protein